MTSVFNAIGNVFSSVESGINRAVTTSGNQAQSGFHPKVVTIKDTAAKTESQPAKIPTSKPAGRRGVQESFLSGVAGGAGATGLDRGWWGGWSGSSGGTRGKALIGQ